MAAPMVAANSGTAYTVTAPDHGEKRLRLTLTDNATLTLSGGTSGEACAVDLMLIQDASGSRTVTWPGNITWGVGGAPTLSTAATKIDRFYLTTDNGGTTWQGFLIGYGYTLPAVPSAPTSLVPVVVSGDVELTWTQGAANRSHVSQNKIYRKTGSGGSYSVLTSIAANTTYTDTTPLTDGTEYFYKVSAVNGVGEGAQSSEVAVTPGQVIVVADDFNRADDTGTTPSNGLIGDVTPVGGKTWLNHLGSGTWSVTSNQANPNSTFTIAVVDAGVSDCTVSVDVITTGASTNHGIRFRQVSSNTGCSLVLDPSGLILQKSISGTTTNVATLGGAIPSGWTGRIAVKMSGSTITVYKDGVQQGSTQTISDAAVLTATKHGFSSGGASTMFFDNFLVTVP